MRHIMPPKNWKICLIDAIERAEDDDVIVVPSDSAKQLGERAARRLCPGKCLSFEIETSSLEKATTP